MPLVNVSDQQEPLNAEQRGAIARTRTLAVVNIGERFEEAAISSMAAQMATGANASECADKAITAAIALETAFCKRQDEITEAINKSADTIAAAALTVMQQQPKAD